MSIKLFNLKENRNNKKINDLTWNIYDEKQDSLKQADIKSVYKKIDFGNDKKTCRPAGISSNASRVCGLCIYTWKNRYFGPILSECRFGFRGDIACSDACLLFLRDKVSL